MKRDGQNLIEEFYLATLERFQQAFSSNAGSQIYHLNIADKVIELAFAGQALKPYILAAFEHLITATKNRNPDLRILLWDSATTEIPMVTRPWDNTSFLPRGEIKGFSNTRFKTVYQPDRNALSITDFKNNQAIYWVKSAKDIPYFEMGAPLLGILPQWFLEQGLCFVHGGAVGTSEGGVLLAGQGGSGKSTTTLLALNPSSSLFYAADDYCLLELGPEVKVHSLYSTGKLEPKLADRFLFIRPALYNYNRLPREKALYFLAPLFFQQLIKNFPLKAILIPKITKTDQTFCSPASAAESFKALAPSTIFQLAGFASCTTQLISEIVGKVPSYNLHLGTNTEMIIPVIRSLLRKLQ